MNFRLLLALALLLMAATAAIAQPLPQVPRYGEFSATWTLPDQTGNPYDPAQNDIDVRFHAPRGRGIVVPAFWDGNEWQVRFAPSAVGNYALEVLRSGHPAMPIGLTTARFRCIPSDNPGFLSTDPRDIQKFHFSSGQFFYPFGIDAAWVSTGEPDYPSTLRLLHQNGLNWARIWMTYWDGKALDWAPNAADNPPIGQFSMRAAQTWDQIFQAAAANHVYIQMVLQHHGQYTNKTDPNWAQNPFNVANGGFLAQPQDFFTNPQAIRLTEAKYRYIVARWGYSTQLMSFELFNEVQNITEALPQFQNVIAWHKTMAAYIRSIDPYRHMITTSFSPPGGRLANIGLSYDQIHSYTAVPLNYFAGLHVRSSPIPVFVGEWGTTGAQTVSSLHDGLWSGIMDADAGGPEFWYWSDVEQNNWWPEFASVSGFLRASGAPNWTGLHRLSPHITRSSGLAPLSFSPLEGWGTATGSTIDAEPDGTVTGLAHLSTFLQGKYNQKLTPEPILIRLTCAQPCSLAVEITGASPSGGTLQLALDGKPMLTQPISAPAKGTNMNDSYSIAIPPGKHTVALSNPGLDWFTIGGITITHYSPMLAVLAKGNAHAAAFWAYSRDRSNTSPVSGAFTLSGLAPGTYHLQFWTPQHGAPLAKAIQIRTPASGRLTIVPPAFTGDLAGWIRREKE